MWLSKAEFLLEFILRLCVIERVVCINSKPSTSVSLFNVYVYIDKQIW